MFVAIVGRVLLADDGPDNATRPLRADGWTGPIIAVTAHAMLEDRQRCLDAGCTDYLAKPIDKQQLLDVVGRYLSKAPLGGVSS